MNQNFPDVTTRQSTAVSDLLDLGQGRARGLLLLTIVCIVAMALGLLVAALGLRFALLTGGVLFLATLTIVMLSPGDPALRYQRITSLLAITVASQFFVFIEPSPFDVLLPVVAVYFFVGGSMSLAWNRSNVDRWFYSLLTLLVVGQIGSLVVGSAPNRSLFFASVTILMAGITAIVYMMCQVDHSVLEIVSKAYVVGAAASTLLVLILVYSEVNIGVPLVRFGSRVQGFFKDPNVFAPYLVLALLLTLALSLNGKISRLGTLVATGPLLWGILFAYSRGGWVNLAVSLAVFWFLRSVQSGDRFVRSALVSLVLLVAAVFLIQSVDIPDDSLFARRLQLQEYDQDRFATQERSLDLFIESPLIGYGPGTTGQLLNYDTHNSYLRLLLENGLVGLLPFLALVVGGILIASRAALKADTEVRRDFAAACAACLVGVAVNSIVIDSVHWRHFWMLIGLGWCFAATHPGLSTKDG